MSRIEVVLASVCLICLGSSAPVAGAQKDDSDLMTQLASIHKQDDSPQKLQAYADLMQSNGPTGKRGMLVRALYLETMFSLYSGEGQRRQILEGLRAMIQATPEEDRDDANREAAQGLLDNHLLVQDAESFAHQGMKLSNAIQERQRLEFKQTQDRIQARFLSTLGQAYMGEGNTKDAKELLSQAFAVDSTNDGAAVALARLSESAGNTTEALNYLIPDVLSGTADDDVKKTLADIYAKAHNNSTTGMEEMLDNAYLKDEAALVSTTKYAGVLPPNPHTVLVELFGSATCGPCVAADLAADAEMRRYSPGEALLVVYHENIPDPDPMTSAETLTRGAFYDINGTPTIYVDGTELRNIGGDRSDSIAAFEKLEKRIDAELASGTTAKIAIDGALSGDKVAGNVVVSGIGRTDQDLNTQIVLVENQVRYVGDNGVRIHPMVARDFINDGKGFVWKSTDKETYTFDFDLGSRNDTLKQYLTGVEKEQDQPFKFESKLLPINPQKLSVIAFVQNTKTKQIIQAAILPISAPTAAAGGGK